MKITLKKLKIAEHLSEETTAFTADVYADGTLIGYAKNDGQGGSTFIHCEYKNKALFEAANAYCEALPKEKYHDMEFAQDLESIVDKLVEAECNKKSLTQAKKKLERNMLKGLCFGTLEHYEIITWKGHTIESILKVPNGAATLINKIAIMGKDKLLNTNLPINIYEPQTTTTKG